jgi:signal transduction histidine kinase
MVIPIPTGLHAGEATGTAVILKDVTQHHEQQELKRSVAATVSHQLKTPLQSLRMSIHLLSEERVGKLNNKQMELVCAAKEESERLKEIMDDFLVLDRIESDRSHLQIEPVSPIVLAREGLETFQSEAKGKGVSLMNAVSEGLPDVMADPLRIRHVFGNLLSNALRFIQPGGSITVNAFHETDVIRFTVEDTGAGIPSEYVNRLFEAFYRAPGQDEKSGVGLGLAIVKEIVEAHGGTVLAQSKIGEGTRMSFTLPVTTHNESNSAFKSQEDPYK